MMAAIETKSNLTNSWHSFQGMSGPILVNNLMKVGSNASTLFDAHLSKTTTTNPGTVDVNPDFPESFSNTVETSTWSYIGE